MIETNTIIGGDTLEELKKLPDECIDCIMTSPPYWSLRDYGVQGQLGLEPNFQEYITALCNIFDEIKRVLKKEGTCWVNLGDTYSGGNRNSGNNISQPKGYKNVQMKPCPETGLPDKSLCLIPMRFAIEMVNRGWTLRNDIVWFKRNSMPTPVKDRFANKWEHIFFFVKSKKYYFDLDSVRKPYLASSINPINTGFSDKVSFNYRVREACKGTLHAKFGKKYSVTPEEIEKFGSPRVRAYRSKFPNQQFKNKAELRKNGTPHDLANCNPKGGNPGDHWDITTQPHPFAHFACYPERLCEVPIKAGCPEGGIVLDPFMGSGTTALMALKLNRRFLGIELNQDYIKIAEARLKPLLGQTKL